MKELLLFGFKLSLVSLLLAYLVSSGRLSPDQLIGRVTSDTGLLLVGMAVLVNVFLCICRQWMILKDMGTELRFWSLFRLSWIAAAFGQLSLGGLVSDGIKGSYLIGQAGVKRSILAVLIDRAVGLSTTLIIWLAFAPLSFQIEVSEWISFLVLIAVVVLAVVAMVARLAPWILSKVYHWIAEALQSETPAGILKLTTSALAWSFFAQAAVFWGLWWASNSGDCQLSLVNATAAGAPAFVSMIIPLPFGAIGTGEWLFHELALSAGGTAAADGCSWANSFLIVRGWFILISLGGLLMFLFNPLSESAH